jgi:hypothetical protein
MPTHDTPREPLFKCPSTEQPRSWPPQDAQSACCCQSVNSTTEHPARTPLRFFSTHGHTNCSCGGRHSLSRSGGASSTAGDSMAGVTSCSCLQAAAAAAVEDMSVQEGTSTHLETLHTPAPLTAKVFACRALAALIPNRQPHRAAHLSE